MMQVRLDMRETWAIVPVKAFERAKTRLRPLLTDTQCAAIARLLAIDVLQVLSCVPALDGILVLGGGSDQARLAAHHGCDHVADDPALDISQNLGRLARLPRFAGPVRLVYMPADLPHVTTSDVTRILSRAGNGITICRALRDGGSNAMVALPASGMFFSLGSGSAERHALAASVRGQQVTILDDIAFQRDIDTPSDLAWLCRHGAPCRTVAYLKESGLDAVIVEQFPESLAS